MASAGPDKKCPERMLVCHDAGGVPSAKKTKKEKKRKKILGKLQSIILAYSYMPACRWVGGEREARLADWPHHDLGCQGQAGVPRVGGD